MIQIGEMTCGELEGSLDENYAFDAEGGVYHEETVHNALMHCKLQVCMQG